MEQKTPRLYPSAPLKNNGLEQRLEKRHSDVASFHNSKNNIEEMITYFNDKQFKSEEKYKKYRKLTTLLKSFDTVVMIATTSSPITLSVRCIGLIAIPISAGTDINW